MAAAHWAGTRYADNLSLPGTELSGRANVLQPALPSQAGGADQIVVHVRTGTINDPAVRARITQVLRRRQGDFPILVRTEGPRPLTVLHMIGTDHLDDYERRAREWARAVWESWSAQHELIQTELDAVRSNTRS